MLQKLTSKYFLTVPSFEYCFDEISHFSTMLGHELSLCPVYPCSVLYPLRCWVGSHYMTLAVFSFLYLHQ